MFANLSFFAQVAATGAALLLAVGCAQPPDLTLRLKEGEKREAEIRVLSQLDLSVMGQSMSVEADQTMVLELTVESVNEDGSAQVAAVIKSVEVDQELGGAGAMMQEILENYSPDYAVIEGTDFSFTLMPDGQVARVDGTADIVNKLEQSALNKLPEMMKKMAGSQISQGLEQQFGNKALMAYLTYSFALAPGDPVEIGGTWEKEMPVPGANPVTASCVLVGEKDGAYMIEYDGEFDSLSLEQAAMGRSLTFSGTHAGKVKVDAKSGWALEHTGTMDGEMPGGKSDRIHIDMEITTRPL